MASQIIIEKRHYSIRNVKFIWNLARELLINLHFSKFIQTYRLDAVLDGLFINKICQFAKKVGFREIDGDTLRNFVNYRRLAFVLILTKNCACAHIWQAKQK